MTIHPSISILDPNEKDNRSPTFAIVCAFSLQSEYQFHGLG